MKIRPGTPLDVTLRWDDNDIQLVGRLTWGDRVALFQFDDAFLSSGIELSPMRHRTEFGVHLPHDGVVFRGLHGVFSDSLPDSWGRQLVDLRARELGIVPTTLTPLDRLACVGNRGIGALCYAPAIDPWEAGDDGIDSDDSIDLDELAADARRILQGEAGEVLAALGKAGSSPGGARPKALIALNDREEAVYGMEDIPPGYTPWLVKFPGVGDPEDIGHIEMAYSMMAKEAGVVMPETRLLAGIGRSYFAARRFDQDGTRRVHVHSVNGLLYADVGAPSLDYRDLIMLTRDLIRDQRDCRDMFTLAVFNVLSHNRDDHSRQFSYIMDRDGTWHLAPAYDLTFSEGPGGEHSMSVLGYGKDITREHLLALGRQADIREQDAHSIIERVEGAVANWKFFAATCDVSRASTKDIATVLKRVSEM